MPTLNINGKDTAVNADDSTPILWALRDTLGMTGTKFGCGQALCGACTVHLNGAPVRSCVTPISAAVGQKITTIEAIAADDKVGKAVHAAWVKHDVAQCGYCQSGQIMSATALLKGKKKPTDADILRCRESLRQIAGVETHLFRPPFGVTNPMVARAVKRTQSRCIGWSVRSFDTLLRRSREAVAERIARRLGDGKVILLHDDRPGADRLLRLVLDDLKRRGYGTATVCELFKIEKP